MSIRRTFFATAAIAALTAQPALAGAKTSVQWGIDRTVSPNALCVYDESNVCQPSLLNLGAAASGANSDITSLMGLTTPLSIPQGGCGATTAAGCVSNLGLAPLGTSGATIPLNNGNNTTSGSNTHNGTETFNSTLTVGASDGLAVHSVMNAAVLADPTLVTLYNGAPPYTSTVTYAQLLNGLGANQSILALPTYSANAISGVTVQTNTSSLSFPTGITGLGILNGAGNYAFGMFAQCFQFSTGSCVGAEFNTWNEKADANGTFPPAGGFPDTSVEPVALQLVAYGGYTSKAALGIGGGVINSGTAKYGFQAGLYAGPGSIGSYGLYIDGNSTYAPITGAIIKTIGNSAGFGLFLQHMNAGVANTYFIGAYNSTSAAQFLVDYAGNVSAAGTFASAGSGGVSCPAGIVVGTFRSVGGIVTHC